MAFTMNCSKCGKINQPFYIKTTDKVHCSLCKKEIENISNISKNQIKSNKLNIKEAFGIKCPHCDNSAKPIINKQKKDSVICGFCNMEFPASPYFIQMMLNKQDKDI